jgi:hypothetical protein
LNNTDSKKRKKLDEAFRHGFPKINRKNFSEFKKKNEKKKIYVSNLAPASQIDQSAWCLRNQKMYWTSLKGLKTCIKLKT